MDFRQDFYDIIVSLILYASADFYAKEKLK